MTAKDTPARETLIEIPCRDTAWLPAAVIVEPDNSKGQSVMLLDLDCLRGRVYLTTNQASDVARALVPGSVVIDAGEVARLRAVERAITNDLRGVFARWDDVTPNDRPIDTRLRASVRNLLERCDEHQPR